MPHLPSEQALCSHPLGQTWPLSPSHLPLVGPKGAGSGEVLWGRGWGLAWGYANPSHHAPWEPHSLGEPRLEARGRDGFGDALPLLLGCSWSQRGQDPPALPAAPPKCCLDGIPAEETGEGFPPSLSHQSSLRGGGSPSLYWCGPGSQSGPALGCEDPWDRWDPWWLLQGPQMSAGQAGIWGCWGWVWKVQDLGSRICTTPPQCRGRNRGMLQPWGCKMPPHPLTEPPPISEPPSPHKGLIWLQD